MVNGSGLLDGVVAAVLGESPTATLCGSYLAEHGATVYKIAACAGLLSQPVCAVSPVTCPIREGEICSVERPPGSM